MSYTLDEEVCSENHLGGLELDPLTGVPFSHLPLPSEAVGREAGRTALTSSTAW